MPPAQPAGNHAKIIYRAQPYGTCSVPVPKTAVRSRKHPGTAVTADDLPLTASAQVRRRFTRWWQVLGSNQRRLSRRFYRPSTAPS
jgi:hypothetical protein